MRTLHVGGINPVKRFKSLELALAEAKDDDTILLHKSVTFCGKITKHIILDGNGYTIYVENGHVGLDCTVPVVIQNLNVCSEPRANGLILRAGGNLTNVKTSINGPARVLFPTVMVKAGTVQLENCILMRVVAEDASTVQATHCTFTDYYGGCFHISNMENQSLFKGNVTMNDCILMCCTLTGKSRINESLIGNFNHNEGDLQLQRCHLEPVDGAPAVNIKKEPSDGPLRGQITDSHFALEQTKGTLAVHGYTSAIPESFIGFFVLGGSVECTNIENHDATGYHIVQVAPLSFSNVIDDCFWETRDTTISLIRSQVKTSTKVKTAMDELNGLIGLTNVKKSVRSILNTIAINQKQQNKNFEFSYHMIFAGDPGTGKTTVAKIVAQALFEIGAVPENKCTEVSIDRLVKGYVGQTAEHVRQVLDDALGGVLFIDEAYELAVNENQNSFNSEVLSVLIRYMEEHRDNLVVIAAGYEKEMKDFLASNVGLTRRFQWVFFDDYSPEEMAHIFESMRKAYKEEYADERLPELLPQLFTKITELYLRKPDRKGRVTNGGNGGLVRNTFQQVLQARNNRVAETPMASLAITQEDLQAGAREELQKAVQL